MIMALKKTLALVGGGNMGTALVRGLLESNTAQPDQIRVAELDEGRRKALETLGVATVPRPEELPPAHVLVIAVKPADVPAATRAAAHCLEREGLCITLAAGVKIATVAQQLPPNQPIVRAMPNTPALVARGATALAAGPTARPEHLETARAIFAAVGVVAVVEEKLMDAVTGLSGSGPAYVFQFIEALADAGVAQGIDRATSLLLAAHTVAGAAELLITGGEHPAVLTDRVASPGGTTIAGLQVLERGGFKGLVMDAVAAATRRGRELGDG